MIYIIKLSLVFIILIIWFIIEKFLRSSMKTPNNYYKIEDSKERELKFRMYVSDFVSLIHSIISFILNFYLSIYYDGYSSKPFKENFYVEFIFIISLTYFIYDLIQNLKLKSFNLMVVHHIFVIIPIFISIFHIKYYAPIYYIFIFGELSNPPFLLARILKENNKYKFWQKINLILFAFLFCFLRSYCVYDIYFKILLKTEFYFYFGFIVESNLISGFKFFLDLYYFDKIYKRI